MNPSEASRLTDKQLTAAVKDWKTSQWNASQANNAAAVFTAEDVLLVLWTEQDRRR